jgi:hypothetical protein
MTDLKVSTDISFLQVHSDHYFPTVVSHCQNFFFYSKCQKAINETRIPLSTVLEASSALGTLNCLLLMKERNPQVGHKKHCAYKVCPSNSISTTFMSKKANLFSKSSSAYLEVFAHCGIKSLVSIVSLNRVLTSIQKK